MAMAVNKKEARLPRAEFNRDELVIINNALNEVCNGLSIDDDEFQTRIGYSRARASKVLAKVARALKD
jgi:hypothetical protein